MAERIEIMQEGHLDGCARLLVATFNAEPWNDGWTYDTAKKALAWTMRVPGFLGFVSLNGGSRPSPPATASPTMCGMSSTSTPSA